MGIENIKLDEMLRNVNNIDYWIDVSKKREVAPRNYSPSKFYFAKDFESGFWNDIEAVEKSAVFENKYAKEEPFSLNVTRDEFKRHCVNIENLLNEHHNFGKENMPGFPKQKCSISSMNMFFSAPKLGYYNSVEVCKHDSNPDLSHCYNAFFFDVEGNNIILWADPTSEQLFKENNPPKNLIFLTGKEKSDYVTNWNFSSDLYPNSYTSIKSVINGSPEKGNVKDMIDEAFRNPKNIDIEDFTFLERKERDVNQFCEFEDY